MELSPVPTKYPKGIRQRGQMLTHTNPDDATRYPVCKTSTRIIGLNPNGLDAVTRTSAFQDLAISSIHLESTSHVRPKGQVKVYIPLNP
jgi:hypothetical protein